MSGSATADCLALSDDEARVVHLEEQLRVAQARASLLEQMAMGAAFEWGRAVGEKEPLTLSDLYVDFRRGAQR